MGSGIPEETQASSLDLLHHWLAADDREPGRAVIEDLARAALPALIESSRQSDPAVSPRSPEDLGHVDARGTTGAAQAAPVSPASPIPGDDLSAPARNRALAGFTTFAAGVLAVIQVAVAYADPGVLTLGVATALVSLTVGGWRRWARQPHTTVLLRGSRLEIVRDGGRHVFDLADPRSRVEVVGQPGERSWRVEFHRRGLAPYVLDAAAVDPAALVRALHAHSPEVHYRPR